MLDVTQMCWECEDFSRMFRLMSKERLSLTKIILLTNFGYIFNSFCGGKKYWISFFFFLSSNFRHNVRFLHSIGETP